MITPNSSLSITPISDFMTSISPILYPNHIPEINITVEDCTILIVQIKNRFGKIIEKMSNLDSKEDNVIKIHYKIIEEEIVDGFSLTALTSQMLLDASSILQQDHYADNLEYFGSVYCQRLSKYIEYFMRQVKEIVLLSYSYANKDFSSSYDKLNEYLVMLLIIDLAFISLPYILQHYMLQVQTHSIAESFSFFPNNDIRDIINQFGQTSTKIEETSVQFSKISQNNNHKLISNIQLLITFISSFIILIIFTFLTYYMAKDFVNVSKIVSKVYANVYPQFYSLKMAFTYLIRLYIIDIDPETQEYLNNRTYLLQKSNSFLEKASEEFNEGMWSENSGIVWFYNNVNLFNYFSTVISSTENEVFPDLSLFERMATSYFDEAINLLISIGYYYLNVYEQNTFSKSDNFIYTMIYWFSTFDYTNRTLIYINMVEENCENMIQVYQKKSDIYCYVSIVWQILAAIFMVLCLFNVHLQIKNALIFYSFVNPFILSKNTNAMKLIETGKTDENEAFSICGSCIVLSKIPDSIVEADTQLKIISYNDPFEKLVNDDSLLANDSCLIKIFGNNGEENDNISFFELVQSINEAICGKNDTPFSKLIKVKINNSEYSFNCEVICITATGPACQIHHELISSIFIIFEDTTNLSIREKIHQDELEKLQKIIDSIIPNKLSRELTINNEISVSFVVNSATICQIKVLKTSYEKLSTIYDYFDSLLPKYLTLSKVRTINNMYCIAGGLFNDINKPYEHSSEAIRFSLEILLRYPSVSIGINVGGPLVCGIMSIKRPTFQMIGPVVKLAVQLCKEKILNTVHISRSVYELIFSDGFNIMERTESENHELDYSQITTYMILPSAENIEK